MNIKRMSRRATLTTVAGVAAFGVGLASASAAGVTLSLPRGLAAPSGVAAAPMPDATYATNAAGLTFGSAALAPSPDQEPDLIAATATNGRDGYVYKKDLEVADGTAAQKSFKSPADALKWQASEAAQADHPVPVYLSDGTTQVGVFVVQGARSQAQAQAAAGVPQK